MANAINVVILQGVSLGDVVMMKAVNLAWSATINPERNVVIVRDPLRGVSNAQIEALARNV